MNYRHSYHAANFADVIKHVLLIALIQSLKKKDKPFCYIDTHASIGYYDLLSDAAQKGKEYQNGIDKIMQQDNPPPLIMDYLNLVQAFNREHTHSKVSSLQYYPGSPMIVRKLLRPKDRMIACELQIEQYGLLKQSFAGDKQVAVHHLDGYLGLKAFLPPPEKRGLILIDPPYEQSNEFTHLAQTLPLALKRFETGIYAIWYPIKDNQAVQQFHRALKQHIDKSILLAELTIYPDLANHLNGSGLAIINPPWQLDKTLETVMPWLWKALTINNQGYYRSTLLQ